MLHHEGTSYFMPCPPNRSDDHAHELAMRLAVALGATPMGQDGSHMEAYRTPESPTNDRFTSVVWDRYRVYLADEESEIILSCRERSVRVDILGQPDAETSVVLTQTLTGYAR